LNFYIRTGTYTTFLTFYSVIGYPVFSLSEFLKPFWCQIYNQHLPPRGAILYWSEHAGEGQYAAAERMLLEHHERYDDKRDGFALRICLSLCFIYMAEGRLEQVRQVRPRHVEPSKPRPLATMQSWAHYFLGLVTISGTIWRPQKLTSPQSLRAAMRLHGCGAQRTDPVGFWSTRCAGVMEKQVVSSTSFASSTWIIRDANDVVTRAMRARLHLLRRPGRGGALADASAHRPDQPMLWLANPYIIKAAPFCSPDKVESRLGRRANAKRAACNCCAHAQYTRRN